MTDHLATVKVSRDGGHNWGAATFHDIGATGDFCKAAKRYRLGANRTLMVEASVSSPYKADVMAMEIQASLEP